jgi:heme O synthase-like polyprenyltransferase
VLNVIAFFVLFRPPTCSQRHTMTATLFRVRLHAVAEAAHVQNIVIGGAAGAVPVLVGWAAVRKL